MKLKVTKEKILGALQTVCGVVSGRSTIPILSNVLLVAEKNRLWLTATDLEVAIRCGIETEVEKIGASTLPAKRLLNIIRELPAEDVDIQIDDKNTASITCGQSYFKVMGLSDEHFPPLQKFNGGFSYTLEQSVFKDMLQKTSYAASMDESRFVLNGVLLTFKNDKLTIVATDGRRLALAEHEMEFPKEAETELILPTKAVNELLHSLRDEGTVRIQTTKTQVSFQCGDTLLISKMIEGTYPNFRQVIPSQCEERVTIERETLLTAIRRVALLASEKQNSVRLTFSKNKLQVSIETPDVGEAREILPVKYTGKEIQVAFNPDFIMDPLRNLTSDEIFFEMTDEMSPGVIKCDVPFIYVLMPMRVG